MRISQSPESKTSLCKTSLCDVSSFSLKETSKICKPRVSIRPHGMGVWGVGSHARTRARSLRFIIAYNQRGTAFFMS